METWHPQAKRLPITTKEYFPTRAVPLISICNHITDGTDSRDYLQNADNGSSVNFLIREENGVAVVYQFMPVEWAAWGNGRTSGISNPYMPGWIKAMIQAGVNINHATVSIEHERKWPFTTLPSDVMTQASIALQRWLADTFPTIRRDRDHIIGHYQIDHIDRANCPGGPGGKLFPFDAVLAALNGPPLDQPLFVPPSSCPITGAFKAFYLAEPKALQYFGLPITDARQEKLSDGNTYLVQYFERARFELHTGQVQLGLVGVEVLTGAHHP